MDCFCLFLYGQRKKIVTAVLNYTKEDMCLLPTCVYTNISKEWYLLMVPQICDRA